MLTPIPRRSRNSKVVCNKTPNVNQRKEFLEFSSTMVFQMLTKTQNKKKLSKVKNLGGILYFGEIYNMSILEKKQLKIDKKSEMDFLTQKRLCQNISSLARKVVRNLHTKKKSPPKKKVLFSQLKVLKFFSKSY